MIDANDSQTGGIANDFRIARGPLSRMRQNLSDQSQAAVRSLHRSRGRASEPYGKRAPREPQADHGGARRAGRRATRADPFVDSQRKAEAVRLSEPDRRLRPVRGADPQGQAVPELLDADSERSGACVRAGASDAGAQAQGEHLLEQAQMKKGSRVASTRASLFFRLAGCLDRNLFVPDDAALDLDGRVGDAEAVFDQGDGALQHILAGDPFLDEDVAAEGVEAGGDRPDMQVVHVADAVEREQRGLYLFMVDAGGRAFHQHMDRLGDDKPGAPQDEDGDDDRDDRIRDVPAEGHHEDARRDGADGAERVAQHVQVGAPHVDVVLHVALARERPGAGQVGQEADGRDRHHRPAGHLGRRSHPADGFVDDEARDDKQGDAVEQRGENLEAVEAVGPLRRGRAGGEPERGEA